MAEKKARKHQAALIITISVFLAVSLGYRLGVFDYLEYKTYDFRVNLSIGSSRPSDDIIVVLLDQNSIDWGYQERGWSWPWPRKAYGEFLEYMRIGGAAAVAFDVLFSEPSLYGAEDDQAFSDATADFGRAVVPVFLETQNEKTSDLDKKLLWSDKPLSWPEALEKPLFQLEHFEGILHEFDLVSKNVQNKQVVAQFPIALLGNAAESIGSITGKVDSDGILRRSSLFTLFDNKPVPSLSAAVLFAEGTSEQISYDKKKQIITWGAYTIPVDKKGRCLLRFRGPLDEYIPYSVAQILQSAEVYEKGEEPFLPPEDFTGKYIFFGYYAPGLYDIFSTPISSVYPGMGIHITMLDNLLQQDFIRESPLWFGILLIFAVTVLINMLVLYTGHIPVAVSGGMVILIIISGLGIGAYYFGGFWIPVVAPLTAMFVTFLTATLYNYATEGKQKQFIKSAFSQYLSPSVIDQLLANPERLSLGGERREISIFFSDVQGFTTISEKLDPTQLTELLNDYLSIMTDTILESGGTIDKYEGDAIIAFWNAPLSYEDHAARALKASLACQELLVERQEFFQTKFGARLLTRIGLNTGYAVVGNMGSNKRFDYTMIGDSVNLAARLEGLNKQFGTYLMCTETTFTQAVREGSFCGRKLALVAVVGKQEPVAVWEPMPEGLFTEKKAILQGFDEARDIFYQGDFARSLPRFQALADQDKPSFYYTEQCYYYLEHPEEWKGFWQARTK